jgi:hypothetical protein
VCVRIVAIGTKLFLPTPMGNGRNVMYVCTIRRYLSPFISEAIAEAFGIPLKQYQNDLDMKMLQVVTPLVSGHRLS